MGDSGEYRPRNVRITTRRRQPPAVHIHIEEDFFNDYDTVYGDYAHASSLLRTVAAWEVINVCYQWDSSRPVLCFHVPLLVALTGLSDTVVELLIREAAARFRFRRLQRSNNHMRPNFIAFHSQTRQHEPINVVLVFLALCLRERQPQRHEVAFWFQSHPNNTIPTHYIHSRMTTPIRCENILPTLMQAGNICSQRGEQAATEFLQRERDRERERGFQTREEELIWAVAVARNSILMTDSLNRRAPTGTPQLPLPLPAGSPVIELDPALAQNSPSRQIDDDQY